MRLIRNSPAVAAPAGTARCRTSRTRNSRPALVAAACRNRRTRKRTDTHQSAWSPSPDVRTPGRSACSAIAAQWSWSVWTMSLSMQTTVYCDAAATANQPGEDADLHGGTICFPPEELEPSDARERPLPNEFPSCGIPVKNSFGSGAVIDCIPHVIEIISVARIVCRAGTPAGRWPVAARPSC